MRRLVLVAVAGLVLACGESDVSRQLGARCDDSDECDERCLQPGTRYPGGFCTVSCDADNDCSVRAACVEDSGGTCLFTCLDDFECGYLGAGWLCVSVPRKAQGTVKVCRGN
jgi:hypothetical protein